MGKPVQFANWEKKATLCKTKKLRKATTVSKVELRGVEKLRTKFLLATDVLWLLLN